MIHASVALTEREHHAALTKAGDTTTGLADLTDSEFERGIARLKSVQARMGRILDEALVEGAHFGNPKTGNGRTAFKKPILYQAGAEEMRRLLRYQVVRVEGQPDQIDTTAEFCSVLVQRAIIDATGRILAVRSGACNTKEKRFRSYDGSGWTYKDARECLHDCVAMAEKRVAVLLTREVSGATAWLAAEDEMEEANGGEADKPITPWTPEEKRAVIDAATAKGLGRGSFMRLVQATLGRAEVGTGADVMALLDAVKKYEKPAKAPASEPQRTADDDALDRRLAEEG